MEREDFIKKIENLNFSREIWNWIDVFGEIYTITLKAGGYPKSDFVPTNSYENVLYLIISRDVSHLAVIYTLFRIEHTDQAAAITRLFLEDLITLKYISLDKITRSEQFLNYSIVEEYEIILKYEEWEKDIVIPEDLVKLKDYRKSIEKEYLSKRPMFEYKTKKGKLEKYSNWCNKNLYEMSKECGPEYERLYNIIYKQASSYVHGTGWSLRHRSDLSAKNYSSKTVLFIYTNITRMITAVWIDWSILVKSELGWNFTQEDIDYIAAKVENLDRNSSNIWSNEI